ncbi:RNA polymerase II elongation factor ELL-like [Polyodon spathula]|uniref:RNA polymerase II elongation factor ELL-like n=1 Tax=Polyodon spathula TaxID=7913 RepID=UPI001B7F4FD9|nr:RNA polymerase II elongation factor ELL-like [Polyodon spathula]
MAALQEERSYGLSCGRLGNGSSVSVFHVKLTDSALRAFEGYQNSKSSMSNRLSIRFTGKQGQIAIPRPECPNELRTFSFYLSNVGRDSPQGSFDCMQQYVTGDGSIQLDCLGGIQDKITVCATDDSYQKARQSMAQVEEETRSRGAIVIKPGGRYVGKEACSTGRYYHDQEKCESNSSTSGKKFGRVPCSCPGVDSSNSGPAHLFPASETLLPHLVGRVAHRGRSRKSLAETGLVGVVFLQLIFLPSLQVANLNGRDGTYTLKGLMFKEVQKDWPGYCEGDQQLLKRILVRKMCQPQSSLGVAGETPASPPKEHSNSASPSQKRPAVDFIDPLANKKPRISHMTSKAQGALNGKVGSSNGKDSALGVPAPLLADPVSSSSHLHRLEIPRPYDPLSDVSNDSSHNGRDCEGQEAAAAERLSHPPAPSAGLPVQTSEATFPSATAGTPASAPGATSASLHGKSKKKSKKHKDKEKSKDRSAEPKRGCEFITETKGSGVPPSSTDLNGACSNSSVPTSTSEMPDYLLKYSLIASQDQRQSYKNDFNAEYNEYRGLHARIESITRQFTVLDTELKQLEQGTETYKTIHNQILQEYRKIKKSNPDYSQEKNRCEYLHSKLAHIKKLIAEYDHQHLQSWH